MTSRIHESYCIEKLMQYFTEYTHNKQYCDNEDKSCRMLDRVGSKVDAITGNAG